jgi:hypothetical protein
MHSASRAAIVLIIFGALISGGRSGARAADAEDDSEKQAAQARKELFTNWMRNFAESTVIRLAAENNQPEVTAKLIPNPVFRYSDEERLIPDATLWVWERDGRPVAFQKVEGNNQGSPKWTICFASLSEGLLKVRWSAGSPYEARTPGVTFKPIPRSDPPAESARARTAQLRALKDRFSGRLGVNDEGQGGAETRTMSKPLFEYADPESKLPLGAIFGMSSTGTNPDLLLLIEARRDGAGAWRWEYATARMTSASLRIRLDEDEIRAEGFAPIQNAVFDNWTFYFLGREFQ